MDFLKKMKSREMIELALKTIMAVIVGIILIFLMERMIYGIYMNKINENIATQYAASDCIAYCEDLGTNEYKVYLHNTKSGSWSIKSFNASKTQIENDGYIEVVYHTPNAFDVSIKTSHYYVMAVFIASIIGFYGWRFYKLNSEYKGFEKKFKKTGKIFA